MAYKKVDKQKKQEMNKTIGTDLFGVKFRNTINVNVKGNNNERRLCLWLSVWTKGTLEFVRTPGSGNRRLKSNLAFVGDIVCTSADTNVFPFVVETKHLNLVYVKPTKDGRLRGSSKLYRVWEQVNKDVKRLSEKRVPIFFVRENFMTKDTWYVGIPHEIGTWMEEKYGITKIANGIDGERLIFKVYHSDDLLKIEYNDLLEYINSTYLCRK